MKNIYFYLVVSLISACTSGSSNSTPPPPPPQNPAPSVSCKENFCSENQFTGDYHCDGKASVGCQIDAQGCPREAARVLCTDSCSAGSCVFNPPMPGASSLLLHSSINSAQSIFQPEYSTATYATLAEAVPGPAYILFEPSAYGNAGRIDANGFQYQWPVDGPMRFRGGNFDFDDPESDGGRVDYWVKFNQDPHTIMENTWLARSNWGERYVNFEFAGATGSPTNLMIDVYSDIQNNYRTNFENFRVSPRGWTAYENIRQGEWHLFTVTWRRNGGAHKAELHIYIDGTQQGCFECNDYNGNLPPIGSITDFFFSPQLYNHYIKFSLDEVYSFDSWDVSGVTGSFANLQIPEGVTLTFPQDARGYFQGVYGRPVPEAYITFEFFAVNIQEPQFECDLYVDTVYVASVITTSQAHTEIADPNPLTTGRHTYQVKCDGDRLVSPLTYFDVALP